MFNETTSNYHFANYVSSRKIKSLIYGFDNFLVFIVENIDFPQGIGKNKKDARLAAARQAMACLLDINEEQINPQYFGR